MSETDLLNAIRLKLSRGTWRLFRNNVGQAWQGRVIEQGHSYLVLADPRPVRFGLASGSGDLIGLRSYIIQPEDVGRTVAVFTSVEGKRNRGPVRDDQHAWARFIRGAGGIAGVARSVDDAERLIGEWRPIDI